MLKVLTWLVTTAVSRAGVALVAATRTVSVADLIIIWKSKLSRCRLGVA